MRRKPIPAPVPAWTCVLAVLAAGPVHAAAGAPAEEVPPAASSPDLAGADAANAPPEVVVVAGRTEQAADAVGQSVTVLTLPQLRADQELVVSDILARTPGVTISRAGGPGEVTSLNIRGAGNDETAVLIDGVKLNDPSSIGAAFNFADLLVSDISRVEVLRGSQSVLYGSRAIGGVVNIVTADPTRPFQGHAQVEGGSYGTLYAKAGTGGREGPLTWRLAANTYTTDGISAFDRRLGGRENDGYQNTGVSGRLGYAFTPDLSVDLRAVYVDAKNRFDGFEPPNYTLGDDAESGRTREFVGYSGVNLGLFGGRLQNRLAGQYTLTQRDNRDPLNEPVDKTFDGRGADARVEYEGSFAIAQGWRAVFGAEHERSSLATSPNYSQDFEPLPPLKAHKSEDDGYGQLQAEVVPGLNLTGGVRYTGDSSFGGHATGQASAAWSLFGAGTVLRASFGQGFKAPSLYQLYSPYGNGGLRPETSNGGDVGVEQRFWSNRASLQATYFRRDSDQLIAFASCPPGAGGRCVAQPGGYYDNTARARAQGVEVQGAVRPLEGVDVTANYTWTDATDRSPGSSTFGRELAHRPRDTANLGASYLWPIKLTTGVALRYAGRSFDDQANSTRLKSYTLVDLRASYPLGHGLEIYGRIENLADYKYETVYGYGTLGRAAYGGVRATF